MVTKPGLVHWLSEAVKRARRSVVVNHQPEVGTQTVGSIMKQAEVKSLVFSLRLLSKQFDQKDVA